MDGNAVDKETIIGSRIGVTLDWSSKKLKINYSPVKLFNSRFTFVTDEQIALTIQHRLIDGFSEFNQNLMSACDSQPVIPSIPVTVRKKTWKSYIKSNN